MIQTGKVLYRVKGAMTSINVPSGVVYITEGAFEGSEGTIVAVDDERQRLTVEVEIFNRKTPAEVEFRQVEAAEA